MALQERIAAHRMVIMGTAGSMWDHLFEGDIAFGEEAVEIRERLIEAAEAKAVTAEILAPLEKPLSDRLGCEARLVLIPYCRNEREQVDLLRSMAAHVEPGDAAHIDVTHGFRHLPMIALISALHLRVAREGEIASIWTAPSILIPARRRFTTWSVFCASPIGFRRCTPMTRTRTTTSSPRC